MLRSHNPHLHLIVQHTWVTTDNALPGILHSGNHLSYNQDEHMLFANDREQDNASQGKYSCHSDISSIHHDLQ